MATDRAMLATLEQLEYGRDGADPGRDMSRQGRGAKDPYRKSVEELKRHLQEFDAKQCEKYAKVNVKNATKEQDMLRVRRMNEQRRNQARMLFWSSMLGSSSMTNTAGTMIGMALGLIVTGGFGPKVGRDGKTRAERRAERISNAVNKLESMERDRAGISRGLGILTSPSARLGFGYMARNMALSNAKRHVPVSVDELGVAYLGNMQATMDAMADIEVRYGGGRNPGKYASEMADLRVDANRRLGTLFEMGAANKVGEREIYSSARRISQQFDNLQMGMSFGSLDGFSSNSMLQAYQTFLDGGDMNRVMAVLQPLGGRGVAHDDMGPGPSRGDGRPDPIDVEAVSVEPVGDDVEEAVVYEPAAIPERTGLDGEAEDVDDVALAEHDELGLFDGSSYRTPVGEVFVHVHDVVCEEFADGSPTSALVCQAVMCEACLAASDMVHGEDEDEVCERARAKMEPYGESAASAVSEAARSMRDVVFDVGRTAGISGSSIMEEDSRPLLEEVISMCRLQVCDVLDNYSSACMDACCGGESAGPVREPYGHFVGTLDNALSDDGLMFAGLGEPGSPDMSERVRDLTLALSEVVEPTDEPMRFTLDNPELEGDFERSLAGMCDALRYDMMGIFSTKSGINDDSFDVEATFEDDEREPTDEDYEAYEAWEDADPHAMHRTFVAAAVSVTMSEVCDSGRFDGARLGVLSASRVLGGNRLAYFRSNDFGFDGLKAAVESVRDGAPVASVVNVMYAASERNDEVSRVDCKLFGGADKPILAYTDEERSQWQNFGEVPTMDPVVPESPEDFERDEGDMYVPTTEEANRMFDDAFSADDGKNLRPISGHDSGVGPDDGLDGPDDRSIR